MHGFWCKACCGHGARYAQCPGCGDIYTSTSYWTGCCYNPSTCENVIIRYYDCCSVNSDRVDECKGDVCGLGGSCEPSWPAYCDAAGHHFICTIVVNTGALCSNPQSHC
jgi:hypothetical protein